MPTWSHFPSYGSFDFDADRLKKFWPRLHAGDAVPLPTEPALLRAWGLFHSGDFQQAVEVGLLAGGSGITAAYKATCIHATYVETNEKARLDLYLEVAEQARTQASREPDNAHAWYWHAYALGRYGQCISVAKALASGLGEKVKQSLETTLRLQPRHADAHLALGTFHAEVIDKVGALIGGMTYGAKKDAGLALFQQAARLNPDSVIGMVEHANALMMLEGDARQDASNRLYQQAAVVEPLDATEWLQVAMARAELAN
jgi:hypothetical protein